jgi:hypothetical protein
LQRPRHQPEALHRRPGVAIEAAEDDEHVHSEHIGGSRHFGVRPLRQAAQACFGRPDWPAAYPVPQWCVEFEAQDGPAVQAAAEELRGKGFTLLHEAPWGQTVARLQSVEGARIGISYAPWLHQGT